MLEVIIPILIIGLTLGLAWPLGRYMRWAMDPANPGKRRLAYERVIERLLGGFIGKDQNWKQYVASMLVFNVLLFVLVFVILTTQGTHPLNPDGKEAMEASLAFNTAASFTSNTNLQHYSGEVSLSYFSQLFGMMWLQFVSAATGIAAVTAMCRGLADQRAVLVFVGPQVAGRLAVNTQAVLGHDHAADTGAKAGHPGGIEVRGVGRGGKAHAVNILHAARKDHHFEAFVKGPQDVPGLVPCSSVPAVELA